MFCHVFHVPLGIMGKDAVFVFKWAVVETITYGDFFK